MASSHKPVPFGIGCIYFELNDRGNPPWKDAVLSALSSVPGIYGVEVDLGVVLPQEAQAGTGYYPTRGMLRFCLHVPAEQQREFFLPGGFRGNAERFTVFTYFRYFEPVTFVIPQESTSVRDAVSGVLLLRQYLERHFLGKNYPVDLRIVGPSPFHVDACTKPGRTSKEFELSRAPGKAHDDYSFIYSKRRFSSSLLAAVYLFERISDELSLFYALISRQEERRIQSFEIAMLTQGLINIYQDRSLKARTRRVVTSSVKIRRVILKVVLAEYQSRDDERVARRQIEELYASDTVPYFKDFLEHEVDSNDASQISAAKEVVSLLDQARQRQIATTALFLSAIAGGLAGALISLLVH